VILLTSASPQDYRHKPPCLASYNFLLFVLFFLGSGLALVRQMLYHLSHASSLFFALVHFQIWSHHFCLGQASDSDHPTYASHVAEVTGVSYHAWLVCLVY
jgi:hypothetical protein